MVKVVREVNVGSGVYFYQLNVGDQIETKKIFNRFYRVDRAGSREEGGTGLGLAIVKHIVQYHHGTIHDRSIKDRGTSFTITIPEK